MLQSTSQSFAQRFINLSVYLPTRLRLLPARATGRACECLGFLLAFSCRSREEFFDFANPSP